MAIYQPDEAGFTALALGPGTQGFALAEAEKWAAELRESAPRDEDRDEALGTYADSITVEPSVVRIKGRYPRAAADIVANVRYASILEVGSKRFDGDYDPPRPMTRLLDRMQAADPFRHKG